MPLPFLIAAPILYGAAAGSATSATFVGVGAGAGGVVLGAGAWWAWGFFSKENAQPSQEHLDSIAAQNRLTEDRIRDASETLASLAAEAVALKQEVREAASNTTISVEQLNHISARIFETTERLAVAITAVREHSRELTDSLPALRDISEKSHLKGVASITMLGELDEHLNLKLRLLQQTTQNILKLQEVIVEQTATIARLGEEVKQLSTENETQREVIAENDIKIRKLTVVSSRLSDHCRFYKQHASSQLNPPENVPTALGPQCN